MSILSDKSENKFAQPGASIRIQYDLGNGLSSLATLLWEEMPRKKALSKITWPSESMQLILQGGSTYDGSNVLEDNESSICKQRRDKDVKPSAIKSWGSS